MKLISESKFAGKTCPKQQLFNRTHKNGSITAHNKPPVEEDKELNEQMVGARIEWKTHTHTHTHIRYYKRNKKNRLEAENRAITKFWVEKRATRRGTFQTFENVSMWQKC